MEKSAKEIRDLVKSTLCIIVFSISSLQILEYEKSEFVISAFVRLRKLKVVEKKLVLVKLEFEKSPLANVDAVKSLLLKSL